MRLGRQCVPIPGIWLRDYVHRQGDILNGPRQWTNVADPGVSAAWTMWDPAKAGLNFASGDELLFFIAGLLFARKAFTRVTLMRFTTERALPSSKVSLQVASKAKNFTLMSMWPGKCFVRNAVWPLEIKSGERRLHLVAAHHVAL